MVSFAKTHSWELFLIRKAFSYEMKAVKDTRALVRAFLSSDPNSKEFYLLYCSLKDDLRDWEPKTQDNRIYHAFSIRVCFMHVARVAYDVLHPDTFGYASFSESTAIIHILISQELEAYSPNSIYSTRPSRELDLINPGLYKKLRTEFESEAALKISTAFKMFVRRNRAARVIQKRWEVCGYNPEYVMCRSRLLKNFEALICNA